jgi:hypothetical protein
MIDLPGLAGMLFILNSLDADHLFAGNLRLDG